MKYIFCVLIFVFQSAFLFCVDYILQEPVFKSNRACSMADAVFSNPIGIDSLLYNPAGLSEKIYSKNEKTSINIYNNININTIIGGNINAIDENVIEPAKHNPKIIHPNLLFSLPIYSINTYHINGIVRFARLKKEIINL